MVYAQEKKVDKNAIVQINVKSSKWSLLPNFFLFLDKPRSYITVNLIFYAPDVANLRFWSLVLTISLKYRQLHNSTEKV